MIENILGSGAGNSLKIMILYEAMNLISAVRTLIFWSSFLFSITFIALVSPILSISNNKEILFQKLTKFFSKLILFFSIIPVEISGIENMTSGNGYILTANHNSFLDNIVLLAKLPALFKYTAYRAGFDLPIISRVFYGAGYIGAGFKDNETIVHSVKLINSLKKRENVMFYSKIAEGGEIGDFQEAIIDLSKRFKIEILPVVIKNSSKIMPILNHNLRSGRIKVMIGKPRFFSDINELKNAFLDIYNNI